MENEQPEESNNETSSTETDWESRTLCSDGNCIGVIGPEELLTAVSCQVFGDVDEGAAAVVPFARIALRVLVCHHVVVGLHHRGAGEVLGGDQLKAVSLSLQLVIYGRGDLGISIIQEVQLNHR